MKKIARKPLFGRRGWILAMSLLLIMGIGVGGTVAYLMTNTREVVNEFVPGEVEGKVEEDFDNSKKTSITVKNTGNTECFVRLMLIPYWVDEDGNQKLGLAAWKPNFTINDSWFTDTVEGVTFYYYMLPVDPEKSTANLIGSNSKIELAVDEDGNRQVLEVFAQCVQSTPKQAVADLWGEQIATRLVQ